MNKENMWINWLRMNGLDSWPGGSFTIASRGVESVTAQVVNGVYSYSPFFRTQIQSSPISWKDNTHIHTLIGMPSGPVRGSVSGWRTLIRTLEKPGIESGTFPLLDTRSTTWATAAHSCVQFTVEENAVGNIESFNQCKFYCSICVYMMYDK